MRENRKRMWGRREVREKTRGGEEEREKRMRKG